MDTPGTTDSTWGLSRRLLALACLPCALALAGVLLVERLGDAEVRQELDRRATLVGVALAEASEYGLISGNAAALDRTVRQLLKQDAAIASIEILDAARRPFISLAGPHRHAAQGFVELPVRSSVPDIDFFDRPAPHVSLVDEAQPSFRPGPVAGYVRVAMSAAPLAAARRERLAWQLGVLLVASGVGVLLVARWGRRLGTALDGAAQALRGVQRGQPEVPAWPEGGPRELRRLQAAVLALAEDGHGRNGDPAPAPAAARDPGSAPGPMTRRIAGRLDAGLIALRLSARHIAALAQEAHPPADDAQTRRAHETVLGILALAEQVGNTGDALFEPWRAGLVQGLGLEAALAALVEACGEAHPGCRFRLQVEAPLPPVALERAALLHRAVHAALAHVAACCGASDVLVRVAAAPPGTLQASVADDGLAEPSVASAARLEHLAHWLDAEGGRCDVSRPAAQGTTVVISLPAPTPA